MMITLHGSNSITLQEILDLESKTNFRFCDDFKKFILENNGSKPENNHINRQYSVQSFIKVQDILKEFKNLDIPNYEYLPIAFDSCGNYFLLDQKGMVYFWDHEYEYPDNISILFDKFNRFLESINPDDIKSLEPDVTKSWVEPAFKEKMIKLGIMKNDKK